LPAAIKSPGDLELASETTAFVSSKKGAAVAKIDVVTGAILGTTDLSSTRIADGSIEPRRLLLVRDRLFVQVARRKANRKIEQGALAVLDTAREGSPLVATIELAGNDARTNEPLSGIEPSLPMVHDTRRDAIFVSAVGNRPSDTGLLARIDATSLAVRDVHRAEAGFQGAVVARAPFSELFVIFHTSTPTTSSHLFRSKLSDDGAIAIEEGGAIVDTFDGLDALAINESGTLVAMANTCVTGFCIGGAGVSFVDARTRAVLPKLSAAAIGFEPSFVLFD
jgi:hypothetical protein